MTPKSLLRHPDAKSKLTDLQDGTHFQRLIPDAVAPEGDSVKRILFCSGKVYYELAKQRELTGLQDSIAIARVEQVKYIQMYMHAYGNAYLTLYKRERKTTRRRK